MLECQSCIDALDIWCQGHVSHYVPLSEDPAPPPPPPTGEAGEQDEAWSIFLREIHVRERSLHSSVVTASIESGLTFETNIPSNPHLWFGEIVFLVNKYVAYVGCLLGY